MVALLATVTLLAAACAGSGGPGQTQATGSGEIAKDTSGTVRILMENVPDTDIVKSMVGDFNKDYPHIKIDIETLTYDQMRDKLVSSFQSSPPIYDLVIDDNPWMVDFANAKFLQPLDARIDGTPGYDAADFFCRSPTSPPSTACVRCAVHNYALGTLQHRRPGTGASVPTTLDELVSTSKALKVGDRAHRDAATAGLQDLRGVGNWLFAAGGSIYGPDGKPS
jgi:ABC-type glycerol-3-phosphate transport system substrate-binding protein